MVPTSSYKISQSYKILHLCKEIWGFPGGSVAKNPPANAGDGWFEPWVEKIPGEGNGNPLQCSCPGNPMDRGAWWTMVHGVTRVRHDLVTKPPPPPMLHCVFYIYMCVCVCKLIYIHTHTHTHTHYTFFIHSSVIGH